MKKRNIGKEIVAGIEEIKDFKKGNIELKNTNMPKKSNTKNQHFISQAEQRLNCIDPSTSKKNRRIYSFTITDRENHVVKLDNNIGERIEENLSFDDLYTLEVVDQQLRYNLEDYFKEHEDRFRPALDSLLTKIEASNNNIASEIIDIT